MGGEWNRGGWEVGSGGEMPGGGWREERDPLMERTDVASAINVPHLPRAHHLRERSLLKAFRFGAREAISEETFREFAVQEGLLAERSR